MNKMPVSVKCVMCGEVHTVHVNEQKYKDWRAGRIKFIQDALPDLTPGERELLLSGICKVCFDKTFSEEE